MCAPTGGDCQADHAQQQPVSVVPHHQSSGLTLIPTPTSATTAPQSIESAAVQSADGSTGSVCSCDCEHSSHDDPPLALPRPHARTQEMVHDSRSIQHLFENNRRWREKKKRVDAEYFERIADKQSPRYLWIGCSDSRVPAEEVTGLAPGEMFVHRNVANLVVSNDISSLSVIQFAVEKLKVKDIIVCGHYGCGGVLAAMENKQLGLLDNWLRNIRDVCRIYQSELVEIPTEKERFRRIVELNIIEQCLNIFKINMVQRNQIKYGIPRIHGLVYDIRTGVLKELDIDFKGYLRKFSGIYRLHSYPTDDLPISRSQLRLNMVRNLVEGHEEYDGQVSIRYITRAMKLETELFTKDDVEACVAFAKSKLTDPSCPFIAIDDLLRYIVDSEEDTDSVSTI